MHTYIHTHTCIPVHIHTYTLLSMYIHVDLYIHYITSSENKFLGLEAGVGKNAYYGTCDVYT